MIKIRPVPTSTPAGEANPAHGALPLVRCLLVRFAQPLLVFRGQHRRRDLEGRLAGEAERHLIFLVVHRGAGASLTWAASGSTCSILGRSR
jgi:hypothetical protein